VLQRAGWALPGPFFLYLKVFLTIKKHEGKNPILLDPIHCGVEVNERDDSEEKHSTKDRDSQLLLPVAVQAAQWENKGKEELHIFCENTKRDKG
jgi:hypothetical protein